MVGSFKFFGGNPDHGQYSQVSCFFNIAGSMLNVAFDGHF